MNKSLIILLTTLLIPFLLKAQDTANSENLFSEARFHYFLKTLVLFNEYLDTDAGSFNTTQLRFLQPIGNKAWNLRFDLPLISTNTNSINKTGIGDIGIGLSYIPYLNHKNGVAIRTRIISNSASDPNFGSGKWVFIPTVFYGKYLQEKKFLWISSLEYQASFAGSDNRNDINTIAFENVLLWFFGNNWISGDVAFRYNNTVKGYQNNAFLEFGRKLTPVNMAYIHPSIGFGGKKSYNYGLEVGFLILF